MGRGDESHAPEGHADAGESRIPLLEHQETGGSARLVRVETDGVDRQTGDPVTVFYEVEVTGFRRPRQVRTFTHERNARVAYLLGGQHGVTDFSLPCGEVGPRLWEEARNLTALGKLPDRSPGAACGPAGMRRGTRINSGDSEAESADGAEGAATPFPAPSEGPAA